MREVPATLLLRKMSETLLKTNRESESDGKPVCTGLMYRNSEDFEGREFGEKRTDEARPAETRVLPRPVLAAQTV